MEGDSKINMSLQEIIAKDKKSRYPKARRAFTPKGAGTRQRVFRNKRLIGLSRARVPVNQRVINTRRFVGRSRIGRPVTPSLLSKAATQNLVDKLVNKAIKQRANQAILRRAGLSRRGFSTRMATMRSGVVVGQRRSLPVTSVRFGGVSSKSRAIAKRIKHQRMLATRPVKVSRGRGRGRMLGRLVSDDVAAVPRQNIVEYIDDSQEINGAAVTESDNIPLVLRRQRRRRPIVMERDIRPVYVQPRYAARNVVASNAFKRRNVPPRFVIVDNENRVRNRTARPFVQSVVRRQPEDSFIQIPGISRQYINRPNVVRMRDALGIGAYNKRNQNRFEVADTFLQRIPAQVRRGQIFRNRRRFLY